MESLEEKNDSCLLELLPLEVVETICRYLSVEDLAACCATSVSMREVFGCDSVWRERCDRELAVYLEGTRCRVKPRFAVPDGSGGSLSPVSHWRRCFMRENHLWNNWRTGNYVEEKLSPLTTASSFKHFYFLGNDIVMLKFSDRIEFWNVQEAPHVKAADDIKISLVHLTQVVITTECDIFILIYGQLVLVYQMIFHLRTITLRHMFFYSESKKIENIKGHDDIEVLASNTGRKLDQSGILCDICIKNFLLLNHSMDLNTIHIWNYFTGVKIKVEHCSLNGKSVNLYNCELRMKYLFSGYTCVLPFRIMNKGYTILGYDLKTLSFTPFKLFYGPSFFLRYVDILDHFVAITGHYGQLGKQCFDVYNMKTSKVVLVNQHTRLNPTVIKNNFMFVEGREVKMFCPYNRTVKSLEVPWPWNDDKQMMSIMSRRFILVPTNRVSGHVYELDNSFRKTDFLMSGDMQYDIPDFMHNDSSTRIIICHFPNLMAYDNSPSIKLYTLW